MTQRLLVVSDLHLTPPCDFDAFHAGETLADFIQKNARTDTTLILAGDVFDLLQLPVRPHTLDMRAAPNLIRTAVTGLGTLPWGRSILQGLQKLLQVGGHCTIIPGNHDPELHHPDTRAILLGALELPETVSLEVHREHAPWSTKVGQWNVLLGHGHRSDSWNDVTPDDLQQSLDGRDSVPLPPGSRLVVNVLRPFKKDERTGVQRFSFIDLLKPEFAVILLLLYLDPKRALALLPSAFDLGKEKILRAFRRQLDSQATTLSHSMANVSEHGVNDAIARAIATEVDEDLRSSPEATFRRLQAWLDGQSNSTKGTLAVHSGARRWLARAALRLLSEDGSFFDLSGSNDTDRAVTEEYLSGGSSPRVVICGHTHAAREHRQGADRVYINTGTWIDLMKLPELTSDEEVQTWVDDIEGSRIRRFCRPTYAEVTTNGAFLREWSPSER